MAKNSDFYAGMRDTVDALAQAERIANDNKYYYNYGATLPNTYDCSSFVCHCFNIPWNVTADMNNGSMTTYGFTYVPCTLTDNDASLASVFQPGYVLLYDGHVQMVHHVEGSKIYRIGAHGINAYVDHPEDSISVQEAPGRRLTNYLIPADGGAPMSGIKKFYPHKTIAQVLEILAGGES